MQGGFFYEMHLSDGRTVSAEEHFKTLKKHLKRIVKTSSNLNGWTWRRRRLFLDWYFKLQMLEAIPASRRSALRNSLVDLARPTRAAHRSLPRPLADQELRLPLEPEPKATEEGGEATAETADVEEAEEAPLLQRVYGIAFLRGGAEGLGGEAAETPSATTGSWAPSGGCFSSTSTRPARR